MPKVNMELIAVAYDVLAHASRDRELYALECMVPAAREHIAEHGDEKVTGAGGAYYLSTAVARAGAIGYALDAMSSNTWPLSSPAYLAIAADEAIVFLSRKHGADASGHLAESERLREQFRSLIRTGAQMLVATSKKETA